MRLSFGSACLSVKNKSNFEKKRKEFKLEFDCCVDKHVGAFSRGVIKVEQAQPAAPDKKDLNKCILKTCTSTLLSEEKPPI